MMNVDNVIITTMMTGNFEPQSWASMASKDLPNYYRLSCEVDGYNVSWECPYIFLFGGVGADGVLCNTIWKGVVNRLTFMPLI